jgi:hypothetical protein
MQRVSSEAGEARLELEELELEERAAVSGLVMRAGVPLYYPVSLL